jgi:hypothetical protein
MVCGSIYKIQFPNEKHYIGLTTTSLEQRTKEHKYLAKMGDTKYLYKALRKYDMVDTFQLIEIDTADTFEELCEKEFEYIIEYNSYYINGNGYNMTFGGEGSNGYVYTEDDKLKISEMCKKYWENPEARKQMSEIMKKYYKYNQGAIKKCSETQIKYNQEHPEKCKIHSEIMKKHFENPEAIKKCSEAQKKRFENPEEIKKNIERTKKYWENPKAREQMSEIKKTYFENPEAIKRCSEAQKKRFENPREIKKKLDTMGKNKPFDVFTKDGTFIKTFTYQFEAKEYLQNEYKISSIISIGSVLAGNRKNSAGFVFKYKLN